MKMIKTSKDMWSCTATWRRDGLCVGLVPTMGYLHEGHASLIQRAMTECDRVVVSIFVNPTQFAANEDLNAYPRDLDRDANLCETLGVDCIFVPEVVGMYPPGFCTYVEVQGLTVNLCGRSRPTHFRGVCTVVSKLFNIVKPHKAYFGQKDAQQLRVIECMVRDLDMGIDVVPCPIIREEDGLAKSSRNVYLNHEERRAALVLYLALAAGQKKLEKGERDAVALIRSMAAVIADEPLARIDYIEVVDVDTLEPVQIVERPVLLALAVFIGKIRLIDNTMFAP